MAVLGWNTAATLNFSIPDVYKRQTMALVAVFKYGVQLQKESDETL